MSINKKFDFETLLNFKNLYILNRVLYCFILMIFFVNCDKNKASLNNNTIIEINDINVSAEEYNLFLEQEKAITYNYFYKKHKVKKNDAFWETEFDGEKPSTYLKEKVNEKIRKIKVIQEYASTIKLTRPFIFTDFVEDWKQDNINRKEKHKLGQVVYGPIENSLKDFYHYISTNLELKLKDKLNSSTFTPSQIELENYFNQIKKSHFSYVDTIAIEQLTFRYKTQNQRIESLRLAKEIIKNSKNGVSFKNIAKKHSQIKYQNKEYLEAVQLYGEENIEREFKEIASKLKLKQIELIDFQQQINSSIYLIRLSKPIKKSIKIFKNVKKEVLYFYQQKEYKHLIDSLIRNSTIKINHKNYLNLEIK